MNSINQEIKKIREQFAQSHFDYEDNYIVGKLKFNAFYFKNSKNDWEIQYQNEVQNTKRDHFVKGDYELKIKSVNGDLEVYETGGKIKSLAKKTKKNLCDFHINPNGSCCLGIFLNKNNEIPLNQFVKERVFPFFVWQAYYEKYKTIPPVGEYLHGDLGKKEFIKDSMKGRNRNKKCSCGSGLKLKKCCLNKVNKIIDEKR